MLHGLWTPGSGLMLWVEDRNPAASEPTDAVGRVLARKFRHHVKVPMPTPSGPEMLEWAAVALAPPDATEFLLSVSGRDPRVAGDLRYLAHVARGVERWARAGRVVPEVHRAEGGWWPRWRLLGGERQRAWLTELAVAMPPVQRHGTTPGPCSTTWSSS